MSLSLTMAFKKSWLVLRLSINTLIDWLSKTTAYTINISWKFIISKPKLGGLDPAP